MNDEFPLPGRLNLAIATVQLAVLLGLLAAAGAVSSPWALAGLAVGYALVMNSTYASMKRSMDCCILTGFFYLAVVLGNGIALVHPRWLKARWADSDRPTRARLDCSSAAPAAAPARPPHAGAARLTPPPLFHTHSH